MTPRAAKLKHGAYIFVLEKIDRFGLEIDLIDLVLLASSEIFTSALYTYFFSDIFLSYFDLFLELRKFFCVLRSLLSSINIIFCN